ncbi:MAG: DUF1015 domain-containing protein [Phycisphaerales bacterium]|nr:DUF1015 domain-containing protein [Phycisphaerales bacterium]
MLRIRALRALRPRAEFAAEVACVPYDVINTEEAAALAEGKPRSFLHVIRPEIDLPRETDPYAAAVYRQGAAALRRFEAEGTLVRDGEPSVYLYRQEMELLGRRRSQTGVVACCHIDDYLNDVIKKHEKTRKDKEDDRTRHVLAQNAHAEPVFFMFKDRAEIAGLIERDSGAGRTPLYDFTAPDGVRHTVWKAGDAAAYVRAFGAVPVAYVADGHHRTASAARAGAEKRAANPGHTGEEPYNWFLAVLFPASRLTILPYHRVVKDLAGLSAAEFLEAVRRAPGVKSVTAAKAAEPRGVGEMGVYVGGGWHSVVFDPATIDRGDPIGSLDYVLLYERILRPVLQVGDLRTDKRIDFVGGIRGPGELERRVNSGEMAVGFCMYPTTIEQLIAVADAGAIMPPKSTWFEPKLRSGLLVNTMEG